MSEKKDAGTALVPAELAPIDLARIPDAGYAELAATDGGRSDLIRRTALGGLLTAGAGGIVTALWWLISAASPLSLWAILAVFSILLFLMGGSASAGYTLWRMGQLVRHHLGNHFGRSERAMLARREGELLDLSKSWNREQRRLRRACRALEKHEAFVRSLPDDHSGKGEKMREVYREWAKMAATHEDLLQWRACLDRETEALREALHGPPMEEPKHLTAPEDPDT